MRLVHGARSNRCNGVTKLLLLLLLLLVVMESTTEYSGRRCLSRSSSSSNMRRRRTSNRLTTRFSILSIVEIESGTHRFCRDSTFFEPQDESTIFSFPIDVEIAFSKKGTYISVRYDQLTPCISATYSIIIRTTSSNSNNSSITDPPLRFHRRQEPCLQLRELWLRSLFDHHCIGLSKANHRSISTPFSSIFLTPLIPGFIALNPTDGQSSAYHVQQHLIQLRSSTLINIHKRSFTLQQFTPKAFRIGINSKLVERGGKTD